jgi:hypothetical protein
MVGKEVTPIKTFSRHNQKTIPPQHKKRHNGTTGMVGKYHLKLYFCHNQKTDTTSQLEKFSSSPHAQRVF